MSNNRTADVAPEPEETPADTAEGLVVVPGPTPAERIFRVQLPDDKWADIDRRLDGEDFLLLYKLDTIDAADKASLVHMYGPIMSMIEKHVVAHNFGGPILRQPIPILMQLWKAWNDAATTAALDPTPAKPSE